MREAFGIGWRMSFSVGQFRGKRPFYKEFTITNALRSQFDFERYEQRLTESPTIGTIVIEGRGR